MLTNRFGVSKFVEVVQIQLLQCRPTCEVVIEIHATIQGKRVFMIHGVVSNQNESSVSNSQKKGMVS